MGKLTGAGPNFDEGADYGNDTDTGYETPEGEAKEGGAVNFEVNPNGQTPAAPVVTQFDATNPRLHNGSVVRD